MKERGQFGSKMQRQEGQANTTSLTLKQLSLEACLKVEATFFENFFNRMELNFNKQKAQNK